MSDPSPYAVLALPVDIPCITSTSRVLDLNYFGPVDDSISIEGSKFVARLSDGTEDEITRTIKEFIATTQSDCVGNAEEKRACWFTIRSTKPSTEFNIPRWHRDGRMYPYDEGREPVVLSKYALTLLGPPTLMLVPDEDSFATERRGIAQHLWWLKKDSRRPSEEERDEADVKLRKWLEIEFKETTRVQIDHGQIVRFSWGRDNSPIHSEPDLICDRIFMSVLYGSEQELRGMCDWRRAKYGEFEIDV